MEEYLYSLNTSKTLELPGVFVFLDSQPGIDLRSITQGGLYGPLNPNTDIFFVPNSYDDE